MAMARASREYTWQITSFIGLVIRPVDAEKVYRADLKRLKLFDFRAPPRGYAVSLSTASGYGTIAALICRS